MTSFEDLGISAKLVDAMKEMGWTEPTPVQCEAVPVGIAGNDVIAKAQTGTGKTGAYAMIVMSRIGKGAKVPSALIITPTRELAMQVDTEMKKLSRFSGHISVPVYGGAPIDRQINSLRRGSDIIVGTPGRLHDMIERDALDLTQVREVVLDEADRMLDMGFEEDLDFIMEHVPEEHQTLLFSATLNDDVLGLAEGTLKDPVEVDISGDTPTTGLTKQYIIPCKRNEKKSILYELLGKGNPKTIVFFSTKVMVDTVYEEMKEKGCKVGTLHGDMPQKLRERVIGDFRDNHLLTLLATDVAARGLDVTDVDMVVNFDLPIDPETYLHRIGRTGRAGKEGVSISIVNPRDRKLVRMCEDEADAEMERIEPDDIEPFDVVHEPVYRERAKKEKKMKVEKHRNNGRKYGEDGEREGFATLEISLGKNDGLNRTEISDFLKQRAGLDDSSIGKVGLKEDCSFVEVSLDDSDFVLENLSGCEYNGKAVTITLAPKKEKNYSDEPSSRVSSDGFDRRRENRYKNYEKRTAREAEDAIEEVSESADSEESEVPETEKDYVEENRGGRSHGGRDRGYGHRGRGYGDRPRREGGYSHHDGGYGRDRGYGHRDRDYGDRPRRDYGERPRREYGDREYVRRDFEEHKEASEGSESFQEGGRGYHERRDYGGRPRREGGYGHRDRDYGDRPRRDYGDRPRRDYGERPRREFHDRDSDRGERSGYSDRGERRDYGGRPRREGGYGHRDGGYGRDRGREDSPRRDYGDRPRRDYGDRPRRDGRDSDGEHKRYPSNRGGPKRYPSNRDKPRKKRDY